MVESKFISTMKKKISRAMQRQRPVSAPVKKEVKKIVNRQLKRNIERKYWDSYTTDHLGCNPLDVPLMFMPTSSIIRGTSDTTRVGDKIMMKSARCGFRLLGDAGNAERSTVTVYILYDKQYTSAGINSGVILEATGRGDEQPIVPFKDAIVDAKRFEVLKKFTMMTNTNRPYAQKEFVLKINRPITYIGDSPNTNQIHLMIGSEYLGQGAPLLYYYIRWYYTDA